MNSLFADYAAHCLRAKTEGFEQVPFVWFVDIFACVMAGTV